MSASDQPPVPPRSGPARPGDGATEDLEATAPATAAGRPGSARPLEATEAVPQAAESAAGEVPRPRPEPTEPYRGPAAVLAEAMGHVRLDPTTWPGSIGRMAHYEVLDVVGRGAMGIVVRAYDTQLCRTVAIKLMSPQLMLSAQARERFFREARAAAGINHPNIVTIHAVSQHAGLPFLVMEFVGGRSLMDRIRSESPMKPGDLLRISVQIASGLAAAHQQGIIHRDIKPANIMLEDSIERVKITDFGLARVFQEQSDLTSQGVVVGTPAYMSPEQVNGEPLGPPSDLFSLGCVLYAMAAGSSPFRGEHPLGIARRVTSQPHISLSEICPEVPADFVAVVDRLLEKDPKDRYPSAAALVGELTEQLADANRGSGAGLPAGRAASGASRRRMGRRLAITGAVVGMASAVLAAVWGWIGLPPGSISRRGLAALGPEGRPGQVGGPARPGPDSGPGLFRVAQNGEADFTTIAEALQRCGSAPGSTIRVEDAAVYEESLSFSGSSGLAGIRLEATAGATLKAASDRTVLMIDRAAQVKVSGFRFETAYRQHAIELRGECPGALVENCQILCTSDSPLAAVYLHAAARGTESDPIRLTHLRIKCGGVGVVMGGREDSQPVSHVRLTDSLIQGPSREYGIPLVLQVGVQHIAVARNLFATGLAGVSLAFDGPNRAEGVVLARNSLGNFHYSFSLNETPPEQAIRVAENLIVESDSLQVGGAGIEAFAPWFEGNWWERSTGLDETLAARIAKVSDPLPLLSRDPQAADYLRPAGTAASMPGRDLAQPGSD